MAANQKNLTDDKIRIQLYILICRGLDRIPQDGVKLVTFHNNLTTNI